MLRRATMIYRGMVQGVGFRYTARAIARRYQVEGYVNNLTDGTVEVIAEGLSGEVERFLADLEEQMGEFIRSHAVRWDDATGEFQGFAVRF